MFPLKTRDHFHYQWSFLKKYALEILEKIGTTNVKPIDTPMDPFLKLIPNQEESYSNHKRYKQLVR